LGCSAALDQFYQQAITRHDDVLDGVDIDLNVRSMLYYIPFAVKAECRTGEPSAGAQ
jgi:hypothetical protein